MKREHDVEAFLKAEVERRSGKAVKLKFIAMAGAPDRLILIPGFLPAFLELKHPDGSGVLSEQQAHWIAVLRRCGVRASVASTASEVLAFLDTMEPL